MQSEDKLVSPHSTSEPAWRGEVVALHRTPRAFLPMGTFDELELVPGHGVVGDRYADATGFYSHKPEEGRQLTLFEEETLHALARDHGITLKSEEHRRNVTTRGVPLTHLVGRRFRIGDAVVEATRLSVPCKHIEEITGQQIFNPLINRSGLNAKILEGGTIRVGDRIVPL
jgi:MOSC domain-containing protein YiiM